MSVLLLVKARVNPGITVPDKNTWRQGDIVACFPVGHVFGGLEGLPDFYQVEVDGITLERAQNMVCCDYFLKDEVGIALNRSRWKFWDSVPAAQQATLSGTGKLRVSQANFLLWTRLSKTPLTSAVASDLDTPPPASPAP